MDNRTIMTVTDNNDGLYNVTIGEGASVSEVAFAISIVIKCFNRDEVISKEEMMQLIDRYLNDVQYEEVQS